MKVITAGAQVIDLGVTEAAPTISMVDFSRRETDDFGVTTVVRRAFSRRMSLRFALPFDETGEVQARMAELRATPARWVASEDHAWLNFEGFYKDFSIDLNVPPRSLCTLTVEGLAETEAVVDAGGDPAPSGESTLLLLQPIAITDGELLTCSVPEDDHATWGADVSYPTGARVIKAHRVFESAAAGNVGHDPVTTPEWWIDIGPTNRWAMFDEALGTATSAIDAISFTLSVDGAEALALLDVWAANVRVQAAGYDRTIAPQNGTAKFLDLPGTGGVITVAISGVGAVSVGSLIVGGLVPLGQTEASPTASITDFSRKEADDFGEVTVVERAWAKNMSVKALIRTDAIDQVANRIASVRARPALWMGDDEAGPLTIYGFFKDFSIEVGDNVSKLSLSVEGLSKAPPPPPYVPVPVLPDGRPGIPDDWIIGGNNEPHSGVPAGELVDKVEQTEIDVALAALNIDALAQNVGSRLDAAEDDLAAQAAASAIAFGELNAGVSALDRAQQLTDTAARQQVRDAGAAAEALLRDLLDGRKTRVRMRDAGIVADPVTGTVHIRAVEEQGERLNQAEIKLIAQDALIQLRATSAWVLEQITLAAFDPSQLAELNDIYARLGAAEVAISGVLASIELKADAADLSALGLTVTNLGITIDALAGTIATKASTTSVTDLAARIGSVETVISTLGDVSSITTAVRQMKFIGEDNALATIKGLLAQHAANKTRRVQMAEARTEYYARLGDGLAAEAGQRELLAVEVEAAAAAIATEATARADKDEALTLQIVAAESAITDLESGLDIANAAISSETATRAAEDEALAESIATLSAALGDQAALIQNEQEANVRQDQTIARMTREFRVIRTDGSDGAEATLKALLAGHAARREAGLQFGLVREDIRTRIVAGEEASASRIDAMLVRMDAAEASVVTERNARVTGDSANANAINVVAASLGELDDAIAAEVARLDLADVTEQLARAAAITGLDARLDGAEAAVTSAQQAIVDLEAGKAEASDLNAVEVRMDDAEAGISSANLAIIDLEATKADASTVTAMTAALGDLEAELTRVDSALVDLEAGKADVSSVTALSAAISDVEAELVLVAAVAADAEGKANSIFGLRQAVGNRISGFTSVNNGDVSEFKIATDYTSIEDPDTGKVFLEATEGELRLNDVEIKIVGPGGSMMKVSGAGFGSSDQFIEWWGPYSANLADCTEANARFALKTDGSLILDGTFISGAIKNSARTTLPTADAEVVMGPAASNGGPRQVSLTYEYSRTMVWQSGAGPAPGVSGALSAQLLIERWTGSGWAVVQTLNVTGSHMTFNDSGQWTYVAGMAGSISTTDTSGGLSVTYRARINMRSVHAVTDPPSGGLMQQDSTLQNLGIASVEG